jgi:hypothetical protein
MSYWTGRFIRTDDGEHGEILDMRGWLPRLRKRELVELIKDKEYLELVAWEPGGKLELVPDYYLADEGTHVSISARSRSSPPPRMAAPLALAALVFIVMSLAVWAMTATVTVQLSPVTYRRSARGGVTQALVPALASPAWVHDLAGLCAVLGGVLLVVCLVRAVRRRA